MRRRLTISLDEEIYRGLQRRVGPGQVGQLIEELLRAYVVSRDDDRDRERDFVAATVSETLD